MEAPELDLTAPNESCQLNHSDIDIISNWKIVNDKLLLNTISSVDVKQSPERAKLEDVVSLETCIRLEGDMNEKKEPCNITIKLKNGQKIARIAIVSEAFLIELYKRFGEYVSTAHAEFIDEFEQSAVYFADARLTPPTPEVTIKFARQKNPGTPMWLYGIRLSLTEAVESSQRSEQFDYSVIGDLLQRKAGAIPKPLNWAKKPAENCEDEDVPAQNMDLLFRNFMSTNINSPKHLDCSFGDDVKPQQGDCMACIGDSKDNNHSFDTKTYIDSRLKEMEERLTERIDVMNYKTNKKLDIIMKLLSDKSH